MKRFLLILLALCLLTTSALAWGKSLEDQYKDACDLLSKGSYAEAAAKFAELGEYEDATMLNVYSASLDAVSKGQYALAQAGFQSLGDFRDSRMQASYCAALEAESAENYEEAMNQLLQIPFFKDSNARILTYPEKINARDYARADQAEQAGQLETALSGFKALGDYSDSKARADAVQEKINARDYAAAVDAENRGNLETALKGFTDLGSYSDSADRAEGVREKIRARDYDAADAAEKKGDYAAALSGFTALGSYRDSAERALAVKDKGTYAQGLQAAEEGNFNKAYELFSSLEDYEDSAQKAYILGVTQFARVEDRGSGRAAFKFHDQYGIINVATNTSVSPCWDEVGEYDENGLAWVKLNNLYGYIDENGNTVIPCTWNAVSGFSGGLCTVAAGAEDNYLFGLYDTTGKEITSAQWRTLALSENSDWNSWFNSCRISVPAISENKLKVQNADGLWGFIDTVGNPVGEVTWESIENFSENVAVVMKNNKYGFLNKDGTVVIEPQYDGALSFSEGLAAVKQGDSWGYINHDNTFVIRPYYAQAQAFQSGIADVYLQGTGWQRIDTAGTLKYFINDRTEEEYQKAMVLVKNQETSQALELLGSLVGYKDVNNVLESITDGVREEKKNEMLKAVRTVGSAVLFGSYEQDNDIGNGPEPIEWIVLDVQGDKALLLSKYGLDAKAYNTKDEKTTWEKCSLRTWLNDEFLNAAFTSFEQRAILMTDVDNSDSQRYTEWDTTGGNNTQDQIFLLSYAEANKYLGVTYDDNNNLKSRMSPTAYTVANGAFVSDNLKTADDRKTGYWFLRSPGSRQDDVAYVSSVGSLLSSRVDSDAGCVRPAFWINLESDVFLESSEDDDTQAVNTPTVKGDGDSFIPGTYTGTGKGFSEYDPVTVKITVDENVITAVEITGPGEEPFGAPQLETYAAALVGRSDGDIDAVAGATMTRDGVKEAVEAALEAARGE